MVRRGLVPVLARRLHSLQPGTVSRHRPTGRQGGREPLPAQVLAPRARARRPRAVLAADEDRPGHRHAGRSGRRGRGGHARGQPGRPRHHGDRARLPGHALGPPRHNRGRPPPRRASRSSTRPRPTSSGPPGPAAPCDGTRGRRHGDEHPQAPPRLHPGKPGVRPVPSAWTTTGSTGDSRPATQRARPGRCWRASTPPGPSWMPTGKSS